MAESIPELITRRMSELQITSLLALHRRLDGPDSITYETVRNLANGKQRSTRDERVIRDLATMLQVDEDTVRAAVGIEPTHGPWELPARAQGLDHHERELVIATVDALLRAKRTGDSDDRQSEAQKIAIAAIDAARGLDDYRQQLADGKIDQAEHDYLVQHDLRLTYGGEAVDLALRWADERTQRDNTEIRSPLRRRAQPRRRSGNVIPFDDGATSDSDPVERAAYTDTPFSPDP